MVKKSLKSRVVGEVAEAPSSPPPLPLEWKFSEFFGEVVLLKSHKLRRVRHHCRWSGNFREDADGYTQMAYDGGVGRQMYFPAQGGVMAPPQPQPQYQAMSSQAVVSSDMRSQEATEVVNVKATKASV